MPKGIRLSPELRYRIAYRFARWAAFNPARGFALMMTRRAHPNVAASTIRDIYYTYKELLDAGLHGQSASSDRQRSLRSRLPGRKTALRRQAAAPADRRAYGSLISGRHV